MEGNSSIIKSVINKKATRKSQPFLKTTRMLVDLSSILICNLFGSTRYATSGSLKAAIWCIPSIPTIGDAIFCLNENPHVVDWVTHRWLWDFGTMVGVYFVLRLCIASGHMVDKSEVWLLKGRGLYGLCWGKRERGITASKSGFQIEERQMKTLHNWNRNPHIFRPHRSLLQPWKEMPGEINSSLW